MHEDRSVKCPTCNKAFGTAQGRAQHLKYCMKKEAKPVVEIQATDTKGQIRIVTTTTNSDARGQATQLTTAWSRTETQSAVDSIQYARW